MTFSDDLIETLESLLKRAGTLVYTMIGSGLTYGLINLRIIVGDVKALVIGILVPQEIALLISFAVYVFAGLGLFIYLRQIQRIIRTLEFDFLMGWPPIQTVLQRGSWILHGNYFHLIVIAIWIGMLFVSRLMVFDEPTLLLILDIKYPALISIMLSCLFIIPVLIYFSIHSAFLGAKNRGLSQVIRIFIWLYPIGGAEAKIFILLLSWLIKEEKEELVYYIENHFTFVGPQRVKRKQYVLSIIQDMDLMGHRPLDIGELFSHTVRKLIRLFGSINIFFKKSKIETTIPSDIEAILNGFMQNKPDLKQKLDKEYVQILFELKNN